MIENIKVKNGIYLRRISHEDAEDVFVLIDKNRNHLRKWLPFIDTTISPDNTHAFIAQLHKSSCREIVFTICFNAQITGLIGFKDIDRANHRVEIGYWISKQNEGNGIVANACSVLIERAFRKMDIHRIQIKCGVGNHRSSNIPKKLGFTFEGIERGGEKHKNSFLDLEVYSLLKNEWRGF